MSKIIRFIPKKELTCKENLAGFIDMAKHQLTLWSDAKKFSWGNHTWRTPQTNLRFIKHCERDLASSKEPETCHLMTPEYADFTKAYLRYKYTLNNRITLKLDLRVLRVMEYALLKTMPTADITKFNKTHFNIAIKEIEPFASRQNMASNLISTLTTLNELGIMPTSSRHWKHPFVGKASYDVLNGSHAKAEVKKNKLPDQDALLAIADVFARGNEQALEDVDTMITSLSCLMMSAPMRAGESLRFRCDCLGSELDSINQLQCYFRYWSPKPKQFTRKPIPEVMADNANLAVKRLIEITNEGRKLALHMEESPHLFYRHANRPNVPDDQLLTKPQVWQALGLSARNSAQDFLKRLTGNRSLSGHTLKSLWKLVLKEHKRLNPHFPYQEPCLDPSAPPLKMSESLMCFRRWQFAINSNTSPVLLSPFNPNYVHRRLCASIKPGTQNIKPLCFFIRNGFEPNRLNTHSLRHLMNRLARQSGITVEFITQWSTRASVKQTYTYLHDDPKEKIDKAVEIFDIEAEHTPADPILIETAEIYSQGPHHRSRYGICRRTWRSGPCNRFADCLNCSELLMCKGDKLALNSVLKEHNSMTRAYQAAQRAIDNGERAASRWTEMARFQIERLNDLIQILRDPNIPDGSPIEISGSDFSHERSILESKIEKKKPKRLQRKTAAIEYSQDLLDCLESLRTSKDA